MLTVLQNQEILNMLQASNKILDTYKITNDNINLSLVCISIIVIFCLFMGLMEEKRDRENKLKDDVSHEEFVNKFIEELKILIVEKYKILPKPRIDYKYETHRSEVVCGSPVLENLWMMANSDVDNPSRPGLTIDDYMNYRKYGMNIAMCLVMQEFSYKTYTESK